MNSFCTHFGFRFCPLTPRIISRFNHFHFRFFELFEESFETRLKIAGVILFNSLGQFVSRGTVMVLFEICNRLYFLKTRCETVPVIGLSLTFSNLTSQTGESFYIYTLAYGY